MSGSVRVARTAALCGGLLSLLQLGGIALAGPYLSSSCGDHACVANALSYGYYQTQWRRWPAESRPDVDFPQSIGAERLLTPEAAEQLPSSRFRPGAGEAPAEGVSPPPAKAPLIGTEIPLFPEPPVEVPGGLPAEAPARPPVEPPEEPSFEAPETPPTETPPETPVEQPAETPIEQPAETPGGGAMAKPLLQGAWAGLPEEPRSASALLGPSWNGGMPGRLPDAGESVPSQVSAPSSQLAAPNAALPALASRSAGEASSARAALAASEAAEAPPPATYQPPALRANWTAALNPGLPGGVAGTAAALSSLQRPQPIALQAAVEPGATLIEGYAPEQPDARPAGYLAEAEQPQQSVPVALDGYCPVELAENERWVPGDSRWSVVYQGRTYLFRSPTQRQRFLADPRRYAPVCGACDPVLAAEGNREVPGRTACCVIYDGRLYMFSSSATLERFKQDPQQYAVGRGQ
jgi:YHS domain-containing protein